MNQFLYQKIVYNLSNMSEADFISEIKKLILNDNILKQTDFKIKNIELTFNSLVVLANYINKNECNLELSKRLKNIQNNKLFFLVYTKLTDEEKIIKRQIFDNLYKEYYELCEKYNWNEQILDELKTKSKLLENTSLTINEEIILSELKIHEIFEYANYYSKAFMGKNRGKEVRKLMNTKEYIFFTMILNDEKMDNIVDYANKYIDKSNIDNLIEEFIRDYSLIENIESSYTLMKIKDTIMTKISTINFDEVNKNNSNLIESNDIEQAPKIIKLFIEGNYRNIKHFCKEVNLRISEFKNYVLLASQNDKELYEKYCLIVKMHENKRNLSNDEIILLLINYIKNGILKDGLLKEFTINDYFNTINIPLEFLIEIIGNNQVLSQNDLKLIRDFFSKKQNSLKLKKL